MICKFSEYALEMTHSYYNIQFYYNVYKTEYVLTIFVFFKIIWFYCSELYSGQTHTIHPSIFQPYHLFCVTVVSGSHVQ